jgi:general secretion pathway protein E/type IV pilus assembly protein PilB
VISELLTVSDDMRKAIEEDKKEMEITSLAKKNGFKPFTFDAGEKIKAGITSVEEVCRVLKIQ